MDQQNHKQSKIIFIAIFVIIILGIIAGSYYLIKKINHLKSPEKQNVSTKWINHKDERGFTLDMPEDWKVNINDWGLIKIGPSPEKADEQIAFALTMIYPNEKTKEEVLEDAKKYFEKDFSNFQILNKKNVDKYNSVLCQIKYTGSNMVGVLNINGSGKNYFVSGFAAPSNELKNDMPDLMKSLASFSYDNSLKNPDSMKSLTQMVSWKDPHENAFTIDVPKDWNIDGGVVRPYIDAALKLVATSGDMGIQIENPYPPIYTIPNQVLAFAGFTEGSHYNPSGGIAEDTIIMSEKDAQNYIETILAKNLNLKVDSIGKRNDLVEKIPKTAYISETTAAEATLSGDGKIHKVIVIEQGIGMSGMGLWTIGLTHYWAPENEIGKVEEIATAMDQSFKLDPTWVKNEQAEIAKRSQIISQSGSEISDIISSTFEYRSSSQDKIADKWSDAILGVQDVYNPSTGENYTVPNTSKYYWTDGLNYVIGTETHDNPGYYWNLDELIPTD